MVLYTAVQKHIEAHAVDEQQTKTKPTKEVSGETWFVCVR
jgi:hypothetical protein